ncbi:MAG: hypothetical protein QY316_09065 [Thermodesulfobacteriota bacterium]|nr:MAG: hypothetical protein QY316_09065 [Thermodesulfobacteriota bacterium]
MEAESSRPDQLNHGVTEFSVTPFFLKNGTVIHFVVHFVNAIKKATLPETGSGSIQGCSEIVIPVQKELDLEKPINLADVVARTISLRNELSIDIPRIIIQPVGNVTRGYKEFTLDLSGVRLQPVENEILIQELHRRQQSLIMSGTGIMPEDKPEDYIVRGLMEFNDICYDEHAGLLYDLAGQAVAHLRTYLKNEDEVLNVLQYHQQPLVNLIHAQMQSHYEEKAAGYEIHVSRGFTNLRVHNYSAPAGEAERDFNVPVSNKQDIRRMLFTGFENAFIGFRNSIRTLRGDSPSYWKRTGTS